MPNHIFQVGHSECIFAALFRMKAKLLVTRQLRLELPPHPDPLPIGEPESGGNGMNATKSLGPLDAAVDPAEVERRKQQQQLQEQQQQQQEQEQQQQQQHQDHQEQQLRERRQHDLKQKELLEGMLDNTALSSKTSGARSPRRPHAARRMADRVITAVREGTRMIMRHTPLNSPRNSPRGPGTWSPRTWSPRSLRLGKTGGDTAEGKEAGGTHSPPNGGTVEDPFANSSVNTLMNRPANSPTDRPANSLAATSPAKISPEPSMPEEQYQRQAQEMTLETEVNHAQSIRYTLLNCNFQSLATGDISKT